MKQFQMGKMSEAKVGQTIRILSGKLADYDKKLKVTQKNKNGMKVGGIYFWSFETKTIDIEIA